MAPKVLYTAAHGGFSREGVPLGGGAAIFEQLLKEWARTDPFSVVPITPAILGTAAPSGRDLVRYGESEYARFSFAFERASTEEVLRHDPNECVVLVNDVSEGPDFTKLQECGYRIFTIYHVDVVAYVTEMYLKGRVRPETTVRWYRKVRAVLPGITRLIWEKQEASVRYSRGLIVPSAGMKDVLLRCYPECEAEKIHVLPWGTFELEAEPVGSAQLRRAALRSEYEVPQDAQVLLTLSRISPEKGQDVLLDALLAWERRGDLPARPLWLFLCGDAAFMQGKQYLERLKRKASRLRKVKVVFPGYVTGERKRAFFSLADLYVFPSRHESYGLTLLEALAAGVPAVCVDHHGARSVMREEFGAIVNADSLGAAIKRLLADDPLRSKMAAAAKEYASGERFQDCAAELAALLRSASALH